MNMLNTTEAFKGKPPVDFLRDSLWTLLEQAAAMRRDLGKRGYLIDQYLSKLFWMLEKNNVENLGDKGYRGVDSLRELCRFAVRGQEKDAAGFKEIKEFVEAHPLPFLEERTKIEYYTVQTADTYLKVCFKKFNDWELEKMCQRYDVEDLAEISRSIEKFLGGDDSLNRLNHHYFDTVFRFRYNDLYLRGFMDNLVYSLLERDRETSRYVFQLLIDGITGLEVRP